MSIDGHRTKWHRNIAENFSGLSRVHDRYRRQTDRQQTVGRRHIANANCHVLCVYFRIYYTCIIFFTRVHVYCTTGRV